jgi:hypothetical protein
MGTERQSDKQQRAKTLYLAISRREDGVVPLMTWEELPEEQRRNIADAIEEVFPVAPSAGVAPIDMLLFCPRCGCSTLTRQSLRSAGRTHRMPRTPAKGAG